MSADNHILMRDLKLNDLVTITCPAHTWLGFLAAYGNTKWSDTFTSAIASEAGKALFDPVTLREWEAEEQRQGDLRRRLLAGIIPGLHTDSDAPPDASGLYGG
jgi:hypothetical protein